MVLAEKNWEEKELEFYFTDAVENRPEKLKNVILKWGVYELSLIHI